MLYERFLAEAEPDCAEIGLKPAELVKVEINVGVPTAIRDAAEVTARDADLEKERILAEIAATDKLLEGLASVLDAPNASYQAYLKKLQEWQERRNRIHGDDSQSGSINYLEAQIASLINVPVQLKGKAEEREKKVRELYRELQQLVSTYKSLYNPVQAFIENHELMSGKYGFEFEASVANVDLSEQIGRAHV